MTPRRPAPDPRFRDPDCLFYGLGAQKAGTTWLHDYLSGHPQVKVPPLFKEQQYWNHVRPPFDAHILPDRPIPRAWEVAKTRLWPLLKRDAATAQWAARQRAVARPRPDHRDHATALLAGWRGERAVGEITPGYARLTLAGFAEMAALSDNTRFFFVMRDPVGRALSAARMMARLPGAGQNAAAHLARALDGSDPAILDFSDYARTIRALEAAVPRAQIAYFFYETLFDQSEVDRLCAHLGVASHPAETGKVVFSFAGEGEDLPKDMIDATCARLAPVYAFLRGRADLSLPDSWRKVGAP